ncbi:hypothetical protein [[Ruminococcus] lactaris]|jgi:hypothetical protein|uniref:Uncharacterized protein n=1 Tax=[Ruminococcus] lactaris ATCC 29176 TaxID=471875 RepID=B5CLJ0_9FIRM|nr:hypothetical protein [[Ruminococcus] lactaris]EDY33842.1 hypothetical protein RUMLAC_00311 [[Ruminococcus] lactaris ATCC 29176]MBS6150294.1 hypothetical protein [[Ruminococcus] lactaris]MBS6791586.1 hypothetical protein [[Ruminococcus] lactaris]MCB5538838.1 hypothetical protein [[Ruminococcus] lactaris]MCB5552737.1 hypothetical protein [[Ruminococcus] lactaris]
MVDKDRYTARKEDSMSMAEPWDQMTANRENGREWKKWMLIDTYWIWQ